LKKTLACKEDLDTKLEDAVGSPASGEASVSGRIRRYYTNTYKSLDQFDQLWYECTYTKRDRAWETCYAWAVILDCFINARSAYCEYYEKTEPIKTFLRAVISEIRDSLTS
jgi:hypothetical protein